MAVVIIWRILDPPCALRQLALQHKDVLIREGLAGDEAVTFHLARSAQGV